MDYLYTTPQGIHKFAKEEGGDLTISSVQETAPILERNKAMANHNDGYSPSREMRRVATIPMVVAHKWLAEEGWWAFDPANSAKLVQKLNDPDYAYLRTAPGRLGVIEGGEGFR